MIWHNVISGVLGVDGGLFLAGGKPPFSFPLVNESIHDVRWILQFIDGRVLTLPAPVQHRLGRRSWRATIPLVEHVAPVAVGHTAHDAIA
jgi:hypothetical protein